MFDPCRVWQHSFIEIDHELFFMVTLSLLLIQEGQLSVSGKRICTNTVQLPGGLRLPRESVVR